MENDFETYIIEVKKCHFSPDTKVPATKKSIDQFTHCGDRYFSIECNLVFNSLLHGAVSIENMDATNTPENKAPNQTTMVERMEKNKYKIPILSDRKTELTKTNPRMEWEQISEYINPTYQKNLEELLEQGTDSLDAQISHHIKGDVIWALGPKAKHEIMRGQLGRELKDINLLSYVSSKKTMRHLMNTGKISWISKGSVNSIE